MKQQQSNEHNAARERDSRDGPKEEEINPNAPWHIKMMGTANKNWSTHKDAIMSFAELTVTRKSLPKKNE